MFQQYSCSSNSQKGIPLDSVRLITKMYVKEAILRRFRPLLRMEVAK